LRQGGLDLNDLRVYDLFVLPIILSAVLVTRRGPVIVAIVSIAFTITSIILLPKSPALQQYWDGTYPYAIGSSYDVVIVPVVLQGLAAVAAWLGADSVRRALLQAYQVEEISAAKLQVEDQQRRLQRGIAHIQQVHSAVAHGQWDARAQVEATELIPVAVSLNLLLDRISRLTRDQEQRQRVDRTAHELAQALRRLRLGDGYTPPAFTGTSFDEVLMELDVLRTVRPTSRPPTSSAPSQGSVPRWPSGPGSQTGTGVPTPGHTPPWTVSGPSQGGAPSTTGGITSGNTGTPPPQSWPTIQPDGDHPTLPQWLRES
jgi:signal transduction histidine kinase